MSLTWLLAMKSYEISKLTKCGLDGFISSKLVAKSRKYRWRSYYVFVLFFIFSIPNFSIATELFENWTSTRALGMGNAFSAVVDDQHALWYNPAALDKIHGLHLTLIDLGIGTDAQNAYQTYNDATGSNYATMIRNFFGKQVWVGVSDSLGFAMHDFAIAAYDYLNLSFNLHNPAYANLNFNITNDVGFLAGTALSLVPGDSMRVGFTMKRITRYGARLPFGPSTLATLSNTQLTQLAGNYGTGYGFDAGMLLELPIGVHPTLSAVWHDVGQTQFTPVAGTVKPPPMDNEAVLGYSMMFDAYVFKFIPAVDFKHANMQEEALGKRLHFGAEFQFPGLSLRGGANQGYYTAGVGLDLKYMKIDAATYGVELNTYPGQLEDRRYMVNITIDLNFDPSIDLTRTPGAKVYQRR